MIGRGKLWIGLGLSAALLALFLLTVDIGKMVDSLADADYVWVAPAIALYLVSIVFRTMRWRVLLMHMKSVSVRRLYPVVVVGYMANNILPMRLGELVRSYYVGEREGVSKGAAAGDRPGREGDGRADAVGVHRRGRTAHPPGRCCPRLRRKVRGGMAPSWLWGHRCLLWSCSGRWSWWPGTRTRPRGWSTGRRACSRLESRRWYQALGGKLILGLAPLKSARAIAVLFVLSAPIWLFEAGLFYLIAISFDLHESLGGYGELALAAVLVTAVANIGSSVPAAPGGIGLFELVARETLVLLPLGVVDRSVAGGYAAVVHAVLLLPMIVLGQAYLWLDHLSLRRLWRSGQPMADET